MSTIYFLAGDKAAALVRDHVERTTNGGNAHRAFIKSIGAVDGYADGTYDFKSSDTPPPGLKKYARPKKSRGRWYIDRKTPEGRAMYERFSKLPSVPSSYSLAAKLVGGHGQMRFGQWAFGHHIIGDVVVIMSRKGWTPPTDCTPMKASAYHLMVEGEE